MKIFSNKSVIGRYHVIAFVFCLIGVVIVYRAIRTMFVEGDVWKAASEKFVKENVSVSPQRGNIFSADGQLLATSLPEYKIYMDFRVKEKDSLRQIELQK